MTGYSPTDRTVIVERMFGFETVAGDMVETRETAAVIALMRRGDRAWHSYSELIEEAGSALAVLEGTGGEPSAPAPPLFDPEPRPTEPIELDPVVEEIEAWRAEGMQS